jgi:predicted AAA+ superfamily ATPase
MSMAHTTMKRYLDLLSGALLIRQLPPGLKMWANASSRRRKYIFATVDSFMPDGLEPWINSRDIPSGGFWEGFALEQVLAAAEAATLLWERMARGAGSCFIEGRAVWVSILNNQQSSVTKSMRMAMQDLALDHLYVLYPGTESFRSTRRSLPSL